MKRSTLWIIGISTAILTVIGLSAGIGRHHWKQQRAYTKGQYHYNKTCNDQIKTNDVK